MIFNQLLNTTAPFCNSLCAQTLVKYVDKWMSQLVYTATNTQLILSCAFIISNVCYRRSSWCILWYFFWSCVNVMMELSLFFREEWAHVAYLEDGLHTIRLPRKTPTQLSKTKECLYWEAGQTHQDFFLALMMLLMSRKTTVCFI